VAAQALFDEGKRLMAAGRVAKACTKFEESQRSDPASGTLFNLAICYEESGRTASAWSTFLEAASVAHTAGNAEREAAARDRARSLAPRLSKVAVRVADDKISGLEVTRDDAPVGAAQWGLFIPADPGRHTFTAKAPGRRPWKGTVTVAPDGTQSEITVPALEVDPNAKASRETPAGGPVGADTTSSSGGLGSQRVLALVAGGIGVVGVGLGTFFTIKSRESHDDADRLCNHSAACPTQEGVDASDAAQQKGTLATISMIVGGVGLASGIALWFTASTPSSPRSTQVGVGFGELHVRGAW
jgi:hypothetical protein